MHFWVREIAGWLLVGLGLFVFYLCVGELMTEYPHYVQVGPLTLIAIIIFRGGIHLLKVAVAARICMKAPALAVQRSSDSEPPRRGWQPLD